MKVLVVGAGGKTGRLVIAQALAAGHAVTALLHSKGETELPPKVETVYGDVRNPATLDRAMTGQQAVIDTVGGTKPFLASDLESSAARAILLVMKRNDVKRLIVVSAMGVGDSREHADFFYEHLLMPVFLRGILPDKANMEHLVETSGLDFVIVRPPVLKDAPATGDVHLVEGPEKAHSITRADLARFLVEQLTADTYLQRQITIANQ